VNDVIYDATDGVLELKMMLYTTLRLLGTALLELPTLKKCVWISA